MSDTNSPEPLPTVSHSVHEYLQRVIYKGSQVQRLTSSITSRYIHVNHAPRGCIEACTHVVIVTNYINA